ncbi:MAG TPA: ABC transporter ATP-binding protein [Candidatus Kapabacteria bacterium]|nr:ABC transporter ATP-binding protein [Candidatus Kapabacteria bacterium]
MELLQIDKIDTGYQKKPVLLDLSMTVKPGEIISIIGPNGAGKSTILKAASGILTLWQGDIFFENISIKKSTTAENIKRGLSYCPQGNRVFDEMSVFDNLEIGGFNLPKKLLKERIEIILQTFPALKRRLKETAGNLSGGEQQMLALSRALIPPTKLLLLDEPSLGLAPNLLGNVFKKLVEINREFNIAMLIAEQKVMDVLEISHRVYSIKLGRVAFEGKPEELKGNKQKIKELFL